MPAEHEDAVQELLEFHQFTFSATVQWSALMMLLLNGAARTFVPFSVLLKK